VDVRRTGHICGQWETEKHLKVGVIESRKNLSSCEACSGESCTLPAILRASLALGPPARRPLLAVLGPAPPDSPSSWPGGCFLFPLTHSIAETKGQQPRQCCPTGADVVRLCKDAPLPGHSSSQTSGCQGTAPARRPYRPEGLRVWWPCPEHSARDSSSGSDLESWEATISVFTFSRTNVHVLIFFYFT